VNQLAPFIQEIARYRPIDILLADIAVRIQLTPTDYLAAVEHYRVMGEWIDRPESPLHGLVDEFYPQGGFATGSTVAAHSDRSDFDLDAMARIRWPRTIVPEVALATQHYAIVGDLGSRYHEKAERKTRCTQIGYDRMHLDVTPSILLLYLPKKTSLIFHSKPSDPSVAQQTLYANPFGLAEWFNARVVVDEAFARFFEDRSLGHDRLRLALAKADTAVVPVQMPAFRKSRQVICLQLIKRWRNVTYERNHKGKRLPPSVLLTYYIGLHTGTPRSLIDELIFQVEAILAIVEEAVALQRLVLARNPCCEQDVLTDRWPGEPVEPAGLPRRTPHLRR